MQLFEIMDKINVYPLVLKSYGVDIDLVNRNLEHADKDGKSQLIMDWIKNNQPCFFGRLGSTGRQNIKIDMCVIDEEDIYKGDNYLIMKLRKERKNWKDRCLKGESDSILYYICSNLLSKLEPSENLILFFKSFANIIFPEFSPIEADVIYVDSAPLEIDGKIYLYKAGINFFHTTAHMTLNHDRRIPGGILLSVNSVGHYANNLVRLRKCDSLHDAVEKVRKNAYMSIGNGGIGDLSARSTSWHNIDPNKTCPFNHKPKHIPEGFNKDEYSAYYQTDVMIPSALTLKTTTLNSSGNDIWKWLKIDYINDKDCVFGDENFGMFHGYPVGKEARYFNPWVPVKAENDPNLRY